MRVLGEHQAVVEAASLAVEEVGGRPWWLLVMKIPMY